MHHQQTREVLTPEQEEPTIGVDNEAVKEVSLADIVRLSQRCPEVCLDRTSRFVTDSGLKPWGFGWYVEWQAQNRREEMRAKCEAKCLDVAAVCPEPERIDTAIQATFKAAEERRRVAEEEAAKANKQSKGGGFSWFGLRKPKPEAQPTPTTPSRFQRATEQHETDEAVALHAAAEASGITPYKWRRCEATSAEFTKMLFVLAQKPSKVDFEDRDRDKKRDMLLGGAPTGQSAGGGSGSGGAPQRTMPVASRYGGAQSQQLPDHLVTTLTDEQQEALKRLANPGLKQQLYDKVNQAAMSQPGKVKGGGPQAPRPKIGDEEVPMTVSELAAQAQAEGRMPSGQSGAAPSGGRSGTEVRF